MKKRIIIAAAITACLALCAAMWPQAETVRETPTPSETTAVIAPQPTLPEAEKPVLPVVTEKKETEMPETKSAPAWPEVNALRCGWAFPSEAVLPLPVRQPLFRL